MRGVVTLCIKQYGECRLVVFAYYSKELPPYYEWWGESQLSALNSRRSIHSPLLTTAESFDSLLLFIAKCLDSSRGLNYVSKIAIGDITYNFQLQISPWFWLSCPSCPAQADPCPSCLVPAVPPRLTCLAVLSQLNCPVSPFPALPS